MNDGGSAAPIHRDQPDARPRGSKLDSCPDYSSTN